MSEAAASGIRGYAPDTLTSMNNLAGLYHNQGKYAEAEPLYLECLK